MYSQQFAKTQYDYHILPPMLHGEGNYVYNYYILSEMVISTSIDWTVTINIY